ncbi:MAG TPA: hypothetical protein PJ982_10015 [Lacipirellulaceae bacterium]|nr:hypothetical protein [Lacipirellulaceae bacterium]
MNVHDSEVTFDIHLQPGEPLALPEKAGEIVGPGHWVVIIRPAERVGDQPGVRQHAAFLSSYAPEDEGLYDDYPTG